MHLNINLLFTITFYDYCYVISTDIPIDCIQFLEFDRYCTTKLNVVIQQSRIITPAILLSRQFLVLATTNHFGIEV